LSPQAFGCCVVGTVPLNNQALVGSSGLMNVVCITTIYNVNIYNNIVFIKIIFVEQTYLGLTRNYDTMTSIIVYCIIIDIIHR